MRLNIAIDGPAGAGKSTVAKSLAEHLNILYLDTGAMYRAVALKALTDGLSPSKIENIQSFLDGVNITVEYADKNQVTYLNGINVSKAIREHHISKAASDISAIPEVRIKLVELQRKIAGECDLVLDGRDIGTYVLPDAGVKFYLTASVEKRAKRRYDELIGRGAEADFDLIFKDIEERDRNDMTRAFAPLRQAEDAVLIDSSDMTAAEVKNTMLKIIRKKGEL